MQQNENFTEQEFDRFLSLCLAGKDRENSQNWVQYLLDQLTSFLGAQKSVIIYGNNRLQILFESGKCDTNLNTVQIYKTAIDRCSQRDDGIIIEYQSDTNLQKLNMGASEIAILCVPISNELAPNVFVQIIKPITAGRFINHEIALVKRIGRIMAPLLIKKSIEINAKNAASTTTLERKLRDQFDFQFIIGHNKKIIELLDLITKVTDVDVPVLIEGESGTGKELVARAIHLNSRRKNNPLVSINCGAIPENLVESEFFGHEKGSFTGAVAKKIGKFEYANKGTLFLDELSSLSLSMQVKLLRVLQWNEFTSVGCISPKKVNVRVVAASNEKLSELVEQKRIRADLYYRLNVLRLELPPLRERKDDIPVLSNYLIEQTCSKMGLEKVSLSPKAMDGLMSYDFPGNVRELENILQRAIILCEGSEIDYAHLPFEVKKNGKASLKVNGDKSTFKTAKSQVVEEFEKQYIKKMLVENRGIVLKAAKKSGMYEANFRAKMKKYEIVVDEVISDYYANR